MLSHYLLTLPYATLALLILSLTRAPKGAYYLTLLAVAILANLPLYYPLTLALSLNDLTFSLTSKLSFFSLIFCALLVLELLQFRQRRRFFITPRGYLFVALTSLVFFLSFLGILPLDLYYLPQASALGLTCALILCAYFFDKILALIYLLCLFAYTLRLFDTLSIFDYFFDAPSFIIALFAYGASKFKGKK